MKSGASIGVGLLYSSGKAFYFAGPVSFLLGWVTIATVYYAVLVKLDDLRGTDKQITLGEMVAYLPLPGAWFALANRLLSPSIVFFYVD